MEKKNRDIVDKIIERLRSNGELPYREGAWERFRATKLKKKRKLAPLWAAATLCLLGASAGYWILNRPSGVDTLMDSTEQLVSGDQVERAKQQQTHPDIESEPVVTPDGASSQGSPLSETLVYLQPLQEGVGNEELPYVISSTISGIGREIPQVTSSLVLSPQWAIVVPKEPATRGAVSLENHILAQDHHTMTVQAQEVDGQDKRFRLNEKFSLGLVVSPSATDRRTNVGGGLLLSYNISNRLSIRTGAAFHQYEVGVLKDPVQSAPVEVARTSERPLRAEAGFYASNGTAHMMSYVPLIPNVNAVSGNVQTIDIPLEAKYTVYKGFYASAGMSYAAILNQKRFAHYVENVNTDPYAKGLPANEAEMRNAVKPVTQTIESASNNVNPSGFGGFVNMSLGTEMKVGKSVSLSLEPYVKLPLGNFKRADMNYTNGGVRIITNF